MDTTFGTDSTKRVMLDVNQVISPTLAVRAGGLFQDANVAGRNYTTDDRDGGFVAVKWTPVDAVKITANYIHYRPARIAGLRRAVLPAEPPVSASLHTAGGPFPDFGVNRNNFYGFVNRDFFTVQQDIGTHQRRSPDHPDLVISDKIRASRSTAELHRHASGIARLANPLSASNAHRQSAEPLSADRRGRQPDRGDLQVRHLMAGSTPRLPASKSRRETSSIDKYTGLSSEALPGGFSGAGSLSRRERILIRNSHSLPFSGTPTLTGHADQDRHRHQRAAM